MFSKDGKSHLDHLETIFHTLHEANSKSAIDKCEFFKTRVEFLSFVISDKGIETNKKKVEAIANYPPPNTLKQLRSFLGLSGYYRRFIKDYAILAKPLTSLLRGEDGRISKQASNKISIKLDSVAPEKFINIRRLPMHRITQSVQFSAKTDTLFISYLEHCVKQKKITQQMKKKC